MMTVNDYVNLHTIRGTNTKQEILDELDKFREMWKVNIKHKEWPKERGFLEWVKDFDIWLSMTSKEREGLVNEQQKE